MSRKLSLPSFPNLTIHFLRPLTYHPTSAGSTLNSWKHKALTCDLQPKRKKRDSLSESPQLPTVRATSFYILQVVIPIPSGYHWIQISHNQESICSIRVWPCLAPKKNQKRIYGPQAKKKSPPKKNMFICKCNKTALTSSFRLASAFTRLQGKSFSCLWHWTQALHDVIQLT